MNIICLLNEMLAREPEQPALIHGHHQISYRELAHRSRAVGSFFQGAGVQPGQRALLLVPLGIDLYVLLLGLLRIGVAVVLIDPTVGKSQITQSIAAVEPDLLIGSPKAHLLRLTSGAIRRITRNFTWQGWILGSRTIHPGNPDACRDAATDPADPALITFTSGSTGRPKAICRTHGFLQHQQAVLCRTLPAQAGAVEMNTLPVFILSSLAQGVTVIMPQQLGKPITAINFAQIIDELDAHRVTRLLAPPAFCQRLVDCLAERDETLPTIRQLYTGGGPVFASLLTSLGQQVPNATVTAVYGSTEAEPIAHIEMAHLPPTDRQAIQKGKGLLAGHPVAEIQLAILPDTVGQPIGALTEADFLNAQLPPNCPGEIVVAGAHVQQGYLWGDDGLTKFNVDHTIWHRTGDAGYLDSDGRLWLLGRCAARVVVGNQVHYPFALEAAAMAHDGVERAAFVQVAGERVLAIQSQPGRWATLRTELQTTMAGMAIDRLQWVATIPMDTRHQSKVLYADLQRLL